MDALTPAPTVPDYGRPAARRKFGCLTWGFVSVAGVGLLASVLLPSLCKPRETASRAKCASNLHQIGLAILLYQQDNRGQYPDTLGRLAENEQIGAEVFVCPSGTDEKSEAVTPAAIAADIDAGAAKHHCSYVYLGRGLTEKTVTDATVVCYEPLENHGGDGFDVLWGDGHADWQTKGQFARLVPATTRPAEGR